MPKTHLPATNRKVEARKGNDTVWAFMCIALSSKKRFYRLMILLGAITTCVVVTAFVLGSVVTQVPDILHGLVSVEFSVFGEPPD